MSELSGRIKHKVDALENWEEQNPVLLKGEIAISIDNAENYQLKVGNGVSPWSDLKNIIPGTGEGSVELPVASSDVLGGVKVGEGLNITEDGLLSALGGVIGSQTILFEGKHLVSAQSVTESGFLSDNIKNYDYITLTTGQEVSSLGLNLRTNTILIDTKTMIENDGSYFQWISNINSDLITGNSLGYTITGNFGDGTQIGIVDFAKGSSAGSRNHYVTRVVGIKLGSSGGSYSETELLSTSIDYAQGGTDGTTIGQDLVLLDDITKYDEIVVKALRVQADGSLWQPKETKMLTSNIIYNNSNTAKGNGSAIDIMIGRPQAFFWCSAWFKDNKTIRINKTQADSGNYSGSKFRFISIKGIKY